MDALAPYAHQCASGNAELHHKGMKVTKSEKSSTAEGAEGTDR